MPYNHLRATASRDKLTQAVMAGTPNFSSPLHQSAPVTSPYGMRVHPILNVPKMHTGVDYGAPKGTPVYASGAGYVSGNTPNPIGGNKVTVTHPGGYTTQYLHLDKYSPQSLKGGNVAQGDLLGWVGTTGRSTGPHLHFQATKDNQTINPTTIFQKPMLAAGSPMMSGVVAGSFAPRVASYSNRVGGPVSFASNMFGGLGNAGAVGGPFGMALSEIFGGAGTANGVAPPPQLAINKT